MKSLTTLIALAVGVILGCIGAASLGVRDAFCTRLSLFDQNYVTTQRNITLAYKQLGDGLTLIDGNKARDAFIESLVIDQAISVSVPNDAAAESGVVYLHCRLGRLSMANDDYPAAARSFEKGLKELELLKRDAKPTDPLPLWVTGAGAPLTHEERAAGADLYRYWHESQEKDLKVCREAEKAIEDLGFALAQSPERVPELLLIRGRALAKHEKIAEAVTTAEQLANMVPTAGKSLFGAAKVYSLAAANMKSSAFGTSSAEIPANSNGYLAKAMELLTRAAEKQFFEDASNRTALAADRDLSALRCREDFKRLEATIASGR